ncbi:MAG TPA: aminopeptidase P family protein [Phycisphaerales bacterium]|nr:aminopeptidase P family protein [Phycisphaerales bacterium]
MDEKTIKNRIKAIRAQLRSKKLDCLILTAAENVTYTTAFSGHDSWVLITPRSVCLFTDSRYTEQAAAECLGCRIIDRKGPMPKAIAAAIARQKSIRTTGLDSRSPLSVLAQLKKNTKLRIKPVPNIAESCRAVKDPHEIKAIAAAAKIAWQSLALSLPKIKPAMTETALAGLIDFNMQKLNARTSFDTIVAFGPNASRPHHQPGTKKLRKNDTILIDFGAKYKGYCCDMTRCFTVGKVTPFYRRVYDAVYAAQQAAIKTIAPGVKISVADAAARQVLKDHNMPEYSHGTGHGLGLEVHEAPYVSATSDTVFQPGQIITIEPGVYIPGKLGVRIEDDILVTDSSHKVLSNDRRHNFSKPELKNYQIK